MNKVITISLSGNAYQLEEGGYDALRAYLDAAHSKLATNPDADEILRDLEQAIADKLTRLMNAHTTVASAADVAQALREMGPVDGTDAEELSQPAPQTSPKRLFLIREGSIIGGVCQGIAAYLSIDVLIVRIAFVVLTFMTGGGMILLYIVMLVFVPYADTPEKLSRAAGVPWNAQEILDRTRDSLAQVKKNGREWKHYWKSQRQTMKWWSRRERQHVHHYYHRSVIDEVVQLAILMGILWAAYTYIPATRPYYEMVGTDIQQGLAWLNAKTQEQ